MTHVTADPCQTRAMLPVEPPLEPMLATAAPEIPAGMAYEPKWDGFRALIFRDDDRVVVHSRGGKDLAGYFPELVVALRERLPAHCVLDGEIVLPVGDRLDFVLLTSRIHPAASRIELLSRRLPVSFVAWDILALGGDDLRDRPFAERREVLLGILRSGSASDPTSGGARVHVSPQTTDRAETSRWFDQFEGAGLDGVMAKPLDAPYLPGKRAMVKIKHRRDADVVVAAWREHKTSTAERPLLGALQLGLYDPAGRLHFVGVASSFTAARRAELADELGRITVPVDSTAWQEHPWGPPPTAEEPDPPKRPGSLSRWSREVKHYHLLDPLRVAEVGYEHMEGARFRTNARFLRWRPDREPGSCRFDQLEEPVSYRLADILT